MDVKRISADVRIEDEDGNVLSVQLVGGGGPIDGAGDTLGLLLTAYLRKVGIGGQQAGPPQPPQQRPVPFVKRGK